MFGFIPAKKAVTATIVPMRSNADATATIIHAVGVSPLALTYGLKDGLGCCFSS
jgi:hypothetical protein